MGYGRNDKIHGARIVLTWKRRPSGEKVLTPRSYSDLVKYIVSVKCVVSKELDLVSGGLQDCLCLDPRGCLFAVRGTSKSVGEYSVEGVESVPAIASVLLY